MSAIAEFVVDWVIGDIDAVVVQLLRGGGSGWLSRQCVVQPDSPRGRTVRPVVLLCRQHSTTTGIVVVRRRTSCLPAGRHSSIRTRQQTASHCAQDPGIQPHRYEDDDNDGDDDDDDDDMDARRNFCKGTRANPPLLPPSKQASSF